MEKISSRHPNNVRTDTNPGFDVQILHVGGGIQKQYPAFVDVRNGDGGTDARDQEKGTDSIAQKPVELFKKQGGYTATPVTCGWAGAIFEVTSAFF